MDVTFYRREKTPGGRVKYVPVSEYNDELMDSYGYGSWLVTVKRGSSSRRKITPEAIPLIAAGELARDKIANKVREISELRPQKQPLTDGQRKAWAKLAKELGDSSATLVGPSAYDIVDGAIESLKDEAVSLLDIPVVKNAYEHFMTVALLNGGGHE